jgi:hypothetical protein
MGRQEGVNEVDNYNKLFFATSFNSLKHLGLYNCTNILSPSPQAAATAVQQQQQQQQLQGSMSSTSTSDHNLPPQSPPPLTGDVTGRSSARLKSTARSMLDTPNTPNNNLTSRSNGGGGGSATARSNATGVGTVGGVSGIFLPPSLMNKNNRSKANGGGKDKETEERNKGKVLLKVFPALESLHMSKIPVIIYIYIVSRELEGRAEYNFITSTSFMQPFSICMNVQCHTHYVPIPPKTITSIIFILSSIIIIKKDVG